MLRVYLDKKAMLVAGAVIEPEARGEGKNAFMQDVLHFEGRRLDLPRDGEAYLCDGSLQYIVPTEFVKFVTGVSYYDNFGYGFHPRRQQGEYRLAGAVGELSQVGTSHYHLKIYAKTLKELRELHSLVRQGQIWPAKDYEAKQVPPPYRHLRDAIGEIWQLIRRDVHDRLHRAKERVAL